MDFHIIPGSFPRNQNPPLLEVLELVEILHSTVELNAEAPETHSWAAWHLAKWNNYTLEDERLEPTNLPFRKEDDLPNLHEYVPC